MVKAKTPAKVITVDNINSEFISVKKDAYNNIVYYFKVNGEMNKLSSMLQSGKDKGYSMPMWMTEKAEIFLKIKDKHIKKDFMFRKNENYILNITFNYFIMEGNADKQINGYFLKLVSYKNQDEMEVEEELEENGI